MNETDRREQLEYQRRRAERRARQRKRQRQELIFKLVVSVLVCSLIVVVGVQVYRVRRTPKEKAVVKEVLLPPKKVTTPPAYDVQLLTVNEFSRPAIALEKVNGIVVHYTANPQTTAQQNRDYFESLSQTGETSVSSHFVIGIEGEIIQCIPCSEISYASNDRNVDTISIECCIPDETGKFTDATYQTLIHLVAWLMGRYDLDIDDVIRHYDVTGKNCPKYYVKYPLEWEKLKENITNYIEVNGTRESVEETETTFDKAA